MVKELITKVHKVLNEVKDFEVGYSTKNMDRGYMVIDYKGKRYAVKAVEITNPAENFAQDVNSAQYFIKEN